MTLARTLLWYGVIFWYGAIFCLAAILSLTLSFVYRGRKPKAITFLPEERDSLSKPAWFGVIPVKPPLPDDIPAEAWALWRAGHSVASLSLLYRGALTRLTAFQGTELKEARTEEECIQLVHRRHQLEVSTYFREIVNTWQRAAYGGLLPTNSDMKRLCEDWPRYLSAVR
jgi:hypothetical protein